MTGQVLFGIDVGSARVRAGLFDAAGQRPAFAVRPIKQDHPHPLHVEQSSTDIWSRTCAAVREAVANAQVAPFRITAIGGDATCSLAENGAVASKTLASLPDAAADMERYRSAMHAWH